MFNSFMQTILDDYHLCNKDSCEHCSADRPINDTGVTYCTFLCQHDEYVKERILKVLESPL